MRRSTWLPLLLLVSACTQGRDEAFRREEAVMQAAAQDVLNGATGEPQQDVVAAKYAGPPYFPDSLGTTTIACKVGFGGPQPILSEFEKVWYSTQLAAAGEPSLYLQSQEPGRPERAASLRFTWLRSFSAPVVVRIETDGSGGQRLVAKRLSGAGGYAPGEVTETIERPLTPAEGKRLRAALERHRVFDVPPDPCGGGCDGAEWIFESAEGARYRFASVWSPEKGPGRELGLVLMKLTGWKLGPVY